MFEEHRVDGRRGNPSQGVAADKTTQVVARPATGAAQSRTITPLKGASELARWIPTEAIALYIAISEGVRSFERARRKELKDLDYTTRSVFYFVMFGVTTALVWLLSTAKNRETNPKAPGKARNIPVFEMAIAALAMAAWAAASCTTLLLRLSLVRRVVSADRAFDDDCVGAADRRRRRADRPHVRRSPGWSRWRIAGFRGREGACRPGPKVVRL